MKLTTLGANVIQLNIEKKVILFSYGTPVAAYIDGIYYRTRTKRSNTTAAHISRWTSDTPIEMPQSYFDNL